MFLDEKPKRQVMTYNQRHSQHKITLGFGAPDPQIDSLIFDSIPNDRLVVEYLTSERDSIAIWIKDRAEDKVLVDGKMVSTIPDTLRGRIVYNRHDSLNNLISHSQDLRLLWRLIETKEQEAERKRQEKARETAIANGEKWEEPSLPNPFKMSLSTTGVINPNKGITLTLDYPLDHFNTELVSFKRITKREAEYEAERFAKVQESNDSLAIAQYRPFTGRDIDFRLEQDSLNTLLWHINSDNWGEFGDSFTLEFPSGVMKNILSQSNDLASYRYSLLDDSEYASIKLNIAEDNTTPSKYIVELLNGAGTTIIERKIGVDAGEVIFRYVPAGNVSIRITQDRNNNGKWDSGNVIKATSPERAQFIINEMGERSIATRKNWAVELDVNPESLFKVESTRELAARLEQEELRRIASICKVKDCKDPSHNHEHNRGGGDGHHSHDHLH